MLHILMYHYVRNNEDFGYDCHARRIDEFDSQVRYLSSQLDIVSPDDLEKISYYIDNDTSSACMFTFDDGYQDHLICSEILSSMGRLLFSLQSISHEVIYCTSMPYIICWDCGV